MLSRMESEIRVRLDQFQVLGFDFDNTILEYDLNKSYSTQYDLVKSGMEVVGGYSHDWAPEHLDEDSMDKIQKCLFIDVDNGKVVKPGPDGEGLGSRGKLWSEDPMKAHSTIGTPGHNASAIPMMDSTNAVATLLFSHGVKANGGNGKSTWVDLLNSIIEMYSCNGGPRDIYMKAQSEPSLFLRETDPRVTEWLKERRKDGKKTLLITSNIEEYTKMAARFSMGKGWEEAFDAIVFSASKPYFFQGEGSVEEKEEIGGTPTFKGGTWDSLVKTLAWEDEFKRPSSSIYFGDNFLTDVIGPSKAGFSTVAIVPELEAESRKSHFNVSSLASNFWGPLLGPPPNLWSRLVEKHALAFIPSILSLVMGESSLDKPTTI